MEFPLYDELAQRVNERLKKDDTSYKMTLENLKETVNNMNSKQLEYITVLFIHWYKLTHNNLDVFSSLHGDQKPKKNLPHGMKILPGGNGYSLDLNKFSGPFQLLLIEFCLYNSPNHTL